MLESHVSLHAEVCPCARQYAAAITHGRPRPRKTFTQLEPVTFVIDASAVTSLSAALFDAKVSGSEVPRATTVIAVHLPYEGKCSRRGGESPLSLDLSAGMRSLREGCSVLVALHMSCSPTTQPKTVAASWMMNVTPPIIERETKKQGL